MRYFAFVLSLLTLSALSNSAGADDSIATAEKNCPGFASWVHVQEIAHKKAASLQKGQMASKPGLPALVRTLRMAERDQTDRKTYFGSRQKDTNALARMQTDDAIDLKQMQAIIGKYGFPTSEMVGADGVDAAWLLIQHADSDPAFQAEALTLIKPLAMKREVSQRDYALLTDRVLLAQGKAQRYGSQLSVKELDHKRSISLREPVEDPKNLGIRRAEMGLMPLSDYICFNKVMYGITD